MKNSGFKPKLLPDPQRQIKEEMKLAKLRQRALNRSRTGAIGSYYEGEWVPSKWELEWKKKLRILENAGKIKDLRKEVITFYIYNEFGEKKSLQIEIDYCFYHVNWKKNCRWDAKPPKVVHTKHGRKYPQKIHSGWLTRFEILKFCEPEHDYRILEKGRPEEIDF